MANVVFNIAKGRVVEYYNRVKSNDPAASALILIPVATAGLEADSVLIDKDDIAAVFAGATDESTLGRKVLTDVELAALPAPDDSGNLYEVALPQVTWVSATGTQFSKIIVAYDADTGVVNDAALIPLTMFDATAIPVGNNIVLDAGGFFRAS